MEIVTIGKGDNFVDGNKFVRIQLSKQLLRKFVRRLQNLIYSMTNLDFMLLTRFCGDRFFRDKLENGCFNLLNAEFFFV